MTYNVFSGTLNPTQSIISYAKADKHRKQSKDISSFLQPYYPDGRNVISFMIFLWWQYQHKARTITTTLPFYHLFYMQLWVSQFLLGSLPPHALEQKLWDKYDKFLMGHTTFLSPNQQCQSTEGNSSTDPNQGTSLTGLIVSSSTTRLLRRTLCSLYTSPLMPVPQNTH